MVEETIPRERWPAFCDEFTRRHHGWRVHMRVVSTDQLMQPPSPPAGGGTLVFQGVTDEPRADQDTLIVTLGDGGGHLSHYIRQPTRVVAENTDQGVPAGLRIDSAEGESMLLAFRVAAPPEALNGLSEMEV